MRLEQTRFSCQTRGLETLFRLKIPWKTILLSLNSKRSMSQDPTASKPLMPLSEVRRAFYEARQQHFKIRREITDQVIQEIQNSRKYAPSRRLLTKQA